MALFRERSALTRTKANAETGACSLEKDGHVNEAIQKMFEPLPRVYELINHIVSLGQDVFWRRKAARRASIRKGSTWLDVSTGTGEMAAYLRRLADAETTVLATDFSMPMLKKAREKKEAKRKRGEPAPDIKQNEPKAVQRDVEQTLAAEKVGPTSTLNAPRPRIHFVLADTGRLPFASASVDLVTISLATRNIYTSKEALLSCFREFHRVLKPGGWFINLETSQPRSGAVRRIFHAYVRGILKPIGIAISGSKSAYSYLANTICNFYDAEELARLIREAGFETVMFERLFLGVAALHKAERADAPSRPVR
jgi:demethylmenaquinone methyltransferase/2-methoxy-6-polyprenyl-1,4-benzoquinol methylase